MQKDDVIVEYPMASLCLRIGMDLISECVNAPRHVKALTNSDVTCQYRY